MSQSDNPTGTVGGAAVAQPLGLHPIYQHPLAYLLGLQGVALFRAFAGEYDRDFVLARLAEVRTLLEVADQLGDGMRVEPISTESAYDGWAESYDGPGNAMLVREQLLVREILDGLPVEAGVGVGVALDAACGTGRHRSTWSPAAIG